MKINILNIISKDIDALLTCVRKYTLFALNNENILLSASKAKQQKINEIKKMLLDKETNFRNGLNNIKHMLIDITK